MLRQHHEAAEVIVNETLHSLEINALHGIRGERNRACSSYVIDFTAGWSFGEQQASDRFRRACTRSVMSTLFAEWKVELLGWEVD